MGRRDKSKTEVDSKALDKLRLDRWLWAARFFKTRGLARDEVNGGKVHVNGERGKPSRIIKLGDEVKVTKGLYSWIVTVEELNDQRRSAVEAQQMYTETDESQVARNLLREQRRLHVMAPAPQNRPDKRDRRRLKAVREQGGESSF